MSVESAYVTLGASFVEGPRMTAAKAHGGVAVVGLWLEMASYCARVVTDGVFPDHVLRKLDVPAKLRNRALAAMVEHGVLERVDGGYLLVDFLKWNAPRKVREDAAQSASRPRPRREQNRSRARAELEQSASRARAGHDQSASRARAELGQSPPVSSDSETLDTPLSAEQSIAKQSVEREKGKEKPPPPRPSLELRPAPDGGSPVPPFVSLPVATDAGVWRQHRVMVFPEDFKPNEADLKLAARYGLDMADVKRVVRECRGKPLGGNGFLVGREHWYFQRELGWAKDRKESQGKRTG